jgi:redox-sensitive bicupin YhaK (pirin superfamily)
MATAKRMSKQLVEVRKAPPKHWVGDGFHVSSIFSYDGSAAALSPFLLLDYGAPRDVAPSTGEPRGVGEHPHRGFETVTIAYQGEIEHRDSAGHHGRIGPGDVQWMTAASGVVHEEKLSREFTRKGGTLEMVQLWVNLPAKLKMSKPAYQDLLDTGIPVVPLAGGAGTVRVIAGEFKGAKGPARTFTPIDLWDLRLKAGKAVELDLPEGHTAALLVLRGEVRVNGSGSAGESELAVLDRRGEGVSVEARKDATVLILSGEPIDEPVVGYGPFVMNTQEEIRQAIRDYQEGRLGEIARTAQVD